MFRRSFFGALLLAGALVPITSCTSTPGLSSIVISPTAPTITLALLPNGTIAPASDQIATLYTAIGYYTRPGHATLMKDLTNQVTWFSNVPDLVTVSNSGVAIPALSAVGYCQITASMPGFDGDIVSNASTYTANLPASFETTDITSLSIQPDSPNVAASAGTTEGFAVIGTSGTGQTYNLTGASRWTSSNPGVFVFNANSATGKTTGYGSSAIVATYTNPDGLSVTAYTTLTVTNPNT